MAMLNVVWMGVVRELWGSILPESQNAWISGTGKGKAAANLRSALPWTLSLPAVRVLVERDSYNLLEFFWASEIVLPKLVVVVSPNGRVTWAQHQSFLLDTAQDQI